MDGEQTKRRTYQKLENVYFFAHFCGVYTRQVNKNVLKCTKTSTKEYKNIQKYIQLNHNLICNGKMFKHVWHSITVLCGLVLLVLHLNCCGLLLLLLLLSWLVWFFVFAEGTCLQRLYAVK